MSIVLVLALALGAALGFGLFFVFLDGGAAASGSAPLWTGPARASARCRHSWR